MANTRELRRRIKSIKNTSQITKAMQMVAATKMRRAQAQALSGRPYNTTFNEAISELLPRIEEGTHPLLSENGSDKTAILLLSTDKSLCGALNTNVFRATLSFLNDSRLTKNDIQFYTLGKKGRQFVVRMGKDLIADFENSDKVDFRLASQIAKLAIDSFLAGEIGQFYVIYPNFITTLRQEPKIVKLLPIKVEDLKSEFSNVISNASEKSQDSKPRDSSASPRNGTGGYLFEPNVSILLEYILNHFVQIKIYQAMLETKASEHSARMIAMQNATDNAKELVDDLTLSYNQTRQESITKELLEITSALAALD